MAGLPLTALTQDQQPAPLAFERSGTPAEDPNETDPFDPCSTAQKLVQVQVEYIEVPQETLTGLLFLRSPKSSDATGLRKKLQKLVSENQAKVLETQVVVGRSGQKTSSESIHEFIFPTEFEPAAVEVKSVKALETAMASSFPFNPAIPTAFETRNLGSILEVEPTVDFDSNLIDLRIVPEIVIHTGNTTWAELKDDKGNSNKIEMPDFHTMRLETAISCIAGQYAFVAALSPANSKGETDMTRKVMVFVKCDVLSVK